MFFWSNSNWLGSEINISGYMEGYRIIGLHFDFDVANNDMVPPNIILNY